MITPESLNGDIADTSPLQSHVTPQARRADEEILGELYAIKAQINRDANYDVIELLKRAREDARHHTRVSH